MSNATKVLNTEYQRVCQQLGDCHLKLKQLKAQIDKLEKEASQLNETARLLIEVENKTIQDLKNQQAANAELTEL
jgi:uncharacterized protein involved in exopolysaccharide biosynthesis